MASALLDRYGSVVNLMEKEGFMANTKVNVIIEGETPVTMAKSTGLALLELPTVFDNLRPDVVLTVGDRFETMATTLAATYMNIALAHTMGGEVSGTIDESIRHAITKFAHIHFPACSEAKDRIIRLGEKPESVFLVGCPRMDLVKEELEKDLLPEDEEWLVRGVGGKVDINGQFLLVSQHPVTTEYGKGRKQIEVTLEAVKKTGVPAIVLWPNADAGSEDIARGIRIFREAESHPKIHFFKNLPVHVYIQLMKRTACLIGNSSSGIREGAFIGTPVVNIGSRQQGRQCGKNALHVDHSLGQISDAIQFQVTHGLYEQDPIYGDGSAGEKIADVLAKCHWDIQKRITY
jgi:UDP-hydrolysing UDP-N-acetyl-D-glucosamine 2-epimerase